MKILLVYLCFFTIFEGAFGNVPFRKLMAHRRILEILKAEEIDSCSEVYKECIPENEHHEFTETLCSYGGYFPVKEDCNKFIQCSNGITYKISCPANLVWNKEITSCDKPDTSQIKLMVVVW